MFLQRSQDGFGLYVLFTFIFLFFCFLLIAPPTEFVSAGITIQNILSGFLGSEQMNFVYYHIKRTTATLLVHSFFPLAYYVGLGLFAPELGLFYPWQLGPFGQIYIGLSLFLPLVTFLLCLYWYRNKWENHPIAKQLSHLVTDPNSTWRSAASSINVEFRRIDKFSTGPHGRRLIVTDSWIMRTSTYFVNVAHQQDIHLSLAQSEEHEISYENMTPSQYLHISVGVVNPQIKSFSVRLNASEFGDLKEKLQAPVRNARNIVVKQSLSDQFLEAFREQISHNPAFRLPPAMEVEQCIGCMQIAANVKLQKLCDEANEGTCIQCFCRPMWCIECMGKWFASRQNQGEPETWMGSKSPCPTCRATFCVLDVSKIEG